MSEQDSRAEGAVESDSFHDPAAPTAEELREAIEIARTTRLLDLTFAKLEEIPDEVFDLEDLEVLRLTANDIRFLPPAIARLRNLKELDLWDNSHCHVPPEIGELVGLEKFSYGPDCFSLPKSMARLKNLRELAIGGNLLGRFPSWLFELEKLETAQLWGNGFRTLPNRWNRLPNLRELNLSRNHLTRLPASFGSLSKLEVLLLDDNNISELPDSMADLPIAFVKLGCNRFEEFPAAVTTWPKLKVLDFFSVTHESVFVRAQDEAQIYHDVDWIDATARSLQRMPTEHIRRRQPMPSLESLPAALRDMPNLEILLLHGHSALQLPEELLGTFDDDGWSGSAKGILDYYFRTRESGRPLNEAKLILLGWGGVGKTSLVNRLVHDRFSPDERRTEGIQVTHWGLAMPDLQPVRLNVWDFGGQEIMHATHQFFLTSRSLYVLVLSGRSGSADADAEYWLRLMESFAPGSPVIVVMNQVLKDPFELDEVGLRQRFPDIKGFVRTDCAADGGGVGIQALRERIIQETSNLADLRVKFPTAWFEIKNSLSAMQENYLSFESFRAMCRKFGETNPAEQEKLAQYLHLLGIALNYREDPRLRDTHVLNPHWVTEGIYAILNSSLVADRKGEIEATDLLQILDSELYPAERHAFLLDLMRKFELCFPYHDEADKFLIAELLPKQQPLDISRYIQRSALSFQYRYPVLPEGLVPRFIVRSHALSIDQPRWRSGCVLSWEGNTALVRAEATDRTIHISVDGPAAGRRRLLAVIRSDFEHIHQSFRFKVEAYVPWKENGRQLMVHYDKLIAAEKNGMTTVQEFSDGEFFNVPVAGLLNGVDLNPRKRESSGRGTIRATGRNTRVFISYSHKDERHENALESHLKVLRRSGLIDTWHDRRIGAGDGWRGLIDTNLREADIVILLVSADFLASDYCHDVEMREAMRRHALGECRVIPVIVRDCNWLHDRSLKELQALPPDGKPVMNWQDSDTAWRIVSQGIEAAARETQTKAAR